MIIANVGAGSGAGGQGGGPFNPVEQALLAEKCSPENRNRIFAANSFVGSIMGSFGALVSGLPQYLQERWGWQPCRPISRSSPSPFSLASFSFSPMPASTSIMFREREKTKDEDGARRFVTKMALLGMVDNLGAGLVGPLMSYWFFLRFGVELKSLGFMFFLSYLFAALSFLAAPVLARHMGVVKTMAFSHGLASIIYLFLPLAPSFSIAAAMTVVRSFLAYMDNPLRSSFIMGIVRPEDRGSAAGITTLSRHVPVAVSPTLSAYLMQSFSLNVPIFIGGFLQLFARLRFLFSLSQREAAGGRSRPRIVTAESRHVSRSSSRRQITHGFARHSRFCFFLFGCGFRHLPGPVGLFDGGRGNDLFGCLHQQRIAHGGLGISFRPLRAKTDPDAAGGFNHCFECHFHLF